MKTLTHAAAIALFGTLAPLAAQADQADDFIIVLQEAAAAEQVAFADVEKLDNGWVEIHDLDVLGQLLAATPIPALEGGDPDASEVILTVDTLRLSPYAMAHLQFMLVGIPGQTVEIGIEAEGVSLFLGALSGIEPFDRLPGYLGDRTEISGDLDMSIVRAPEDHGATVDIQIVLADMGQIAVHYQPLSAQDAALDVALTDGSGHDVLGLSTFFVRTWFEIALANMAVFAQVALPVEDLPPEMTAMVEEVEAQLTAMRDGIAAMPATGEEAAGRLALWANEMAQALPEFADTLHAFAQFAEAEGTLDLAMNTGGSGEGLGDFVGFQSLNDANMIARVLQALALQATFSPDE